MDMDFRIAYERHYGELGRKTEAYVPSAAGRDRERDASRRDEVVVEPEAGGAVRPVARFRQRGVRHADRGRLRPGRARKRDVRVGGSFRCRGRRGRKRTGDSSAIVLGRAPRRVESAVRLRGKPPIVAFRRRGGAGQLPAARDGCRAFSGGSVEIRHVRGDPGHDGGVPGRDGARRRVPSPPRGDRAGSAARTRHTRRCGQYLHH